jgi:crossover junction endodeoxyribonuclease RuvC
MIIVGIDPGTARMGYGVIKVGDKGKVIDLIDSDVIITKPTLEPENRLKYLYKRLFDVIQEHKPDVVVIEKLFFNTNAKTAMTVGQARGVSMLAAANNKVKVIEYTALQAKLELTGYGRSDKKQMQEAVKKMLSLSSKVKSDDANDAVAMAICFVRKTLVKTKKTAKKKTKKCSK